MSIFFSCCLRVRRTGVSHWPWRETTRARSPAPLGVWTSTTRRIRRRCPNSWPTTTPPTTWTRSRNAWSPLRSSTSSNHSSSKKTARFWNRHPFLRVLLPPTPSAEELGNYLTFKWDKKKRRKTIWVKAWLPDGGRSICFILWVS